MVGGWARPVAAEDETRACIVASDEGQKLRDEGKLIAARDRFIQCARDACPEPIRKECSQWLNALEPRVPSVVLEARGSRGEDLTGVRVTIDGVAVNKTLDGRAIAIDPGPHRFRFEVNRRAPVEKRVIVREGEKGRRVRVVIDTAVGAGHARAGPPRAALREEPISRLTVVALVLGGVGVAALGGFALLGVTGQSEKNHLEDTCAPTRTCASADVDAARNKLIAADVLLGVGVVAVGIAVTLFVLPNAD